LATPTSGSGVRRAVTLVAASDGLAKAREFRAALIAAVADPTRRPPVTGEGIAHMLSRQFAPDGATATDTMIDDLRPAPEPEVTRANVYVDWERDRG
jgi:hypothetical protein